MRFRFFASALLCTSFAMAKENLPAEPSTMSVQDQLAETTQSSVKKLDNTRYQIGEIIFDEKSREIRFPVSVNMTEGLLEFLVVHQSGKIHESLFHTEISPTQLNLALTLLRYPTSKELYPLPNERGDVSDRYPDVSAEVKAAARVIIEAEWTEDEKIHRFPVNEMIQHEVKATAMAAGPWVYSGSDFSDGKFVAETSGDIIAIYLAMSALINFPGEDHGNDSVWIPFQKRLPAHGSVITLIIRPY